MNVYNINDFSLNADTSNVTLPPKAERLDWILPEVINVILIVLTLWIIISLVHFGFRSGKWKKTTRNDQKLDGGLIYSSVILCAFCVLLRLANDQIAFHVGYSDSKYDQKLCEIVFDGLIIMYCLVVFSVYIFLWLRQRMFYTNDMLQLKYNRFIKVASLISLPLMCLCTISVILVMTLSIKHPPSASGCQWIPTEGGVPSVYWVTACVAIITFGQVMMLGLLIYPLQASQRKMKLLSCSCNCFKKKRSPETSTSHIVLNNGPESFVSVKSDNSNLVVDCATPIRRCDGQRKSKTFQSVRKIILRTTVLAVISISLDACLLIYLYLEMENGKLVRIGMILYDTNSFLSLIFVICSFTAYKNMLCSPFIKSIEMIQSHSSL
ncbi:unnamed protein product [Clavelina lepadiformis]|uniref:G-protein coupled receptors family 1 profile domain-containing protein n=1 Tax=Clavelina lepadiformis TaxID=159417 RepID=A0ABP0FZ03_CLALP